VVAPVRLRSPDLANVAPQPDARHERCRSTLREALGVGPSAARPARHACWWSDRSNLEKSVSDLIDIKLDSNTLNRLESQRKQVQSDAKALVSAASP